MQQSAALIEPRCGVLAFIGARAFTSVPGQAFDLVAALERRPRNHQVQFRNFGLGAALAADARRRAPDVIAAAPDKIVLWLGAADVLASLSRRPPAASDPIRFHDHVATLVRRLQMGAEAAIAICSIAPIGEDPAPVTGLQLELNRRVAEYSAILAAVAREARCAYIPVGEALAARIDAAPGRAYAGVNPLGLCRDAFRAAALRAGSDQIGDRNGWRFHADGVHLNDRAGQIAADLVQRFLDA